MSSAGSASGSAAGPIGVVILGVPGRMGLSLLGLLPHFPGLKLQAAVARPGSVALGCDSGELAGGAPSGVRVSSDVEAALKNAGLAIDFSSAEAAPAHLRSCSEAGVPLLLGTTGLGTEIPALVATAARSIPVLVAANTSVAVAVLRELVQTAATRLGRTFGIEIHDRHHASKRDAPSGTALMLGAAASSAANLKPGRIEYVSTREGETVGDHEVLFVGAGERLSLGHSATDRSVFARGALQAGSWLARQKPGSYGMADALREK